LLQEEQDVIMPRVVKGIRYGQRTGKEESTWKAVLEFK
jgi:hypothetical protein